MNSILHLDVPPSNGNTALVKRGKGLEGRRGEVDAILRATRAGVNDSGVDGPASI